MTVGFRRESAKCTIDHKPRPADCLRTGHHANAEQEQRKRELKEQKKRQMKVKVRGFYYVKTTDSRYGTELILPAYSLAYRTALQCLLLDLFICSFAGCNLVLLPSIGQIALLDCSDREDVVPSSVTLSPEAYLVARGVVPRESQALNIDW